MHDEIGQRCVQDRRGIELLPSDGSPDHGEDAGTDDRANAQRRQRPRAEGLLQPMFRLLRLGDQFVDRLTREELVRQNSAPGDEGIDASGFKQKKRHWASLPNQPAAERPGLPPSFPFAREARFLALLVLLPPAAPSLAAIHFREPIDPSRSAGTYKSTSSFGK